MDWTTLSLTVLAHAPAAIAAWYAFRTKRQVTSLHVQINGRMDDWIKAVQATAHAEGVAKGKESREP